MKRKTAVVTAVVVVLVIGTGIAAWLRFREGQEVGVIRVSGNIEVTDVNVSFKIPGRLLQRSVDEGMSVSAGQPVARLDSADLEREVSMKEAELQAAQAVLRELVAGLRPQEIARARAVVAAAQAEAERLSGEFDRARALHARDVISRQEFERARAAYDVADERRKEARGSLLPRGGRTQARTDRAIPCPVPAGKRVPGTRPHAPLLRNDRLPPCGSGPFQER